MTLIVGSLLRDRYRIDRLLAEGGMGVVYAAWDLNLGVACAIKENRLVTESGMQRFEREARLLASVRHSNLPNVVDYFSIPAQGQYLVMSYIEGDDLKHLLEKGGALPEAQVISWATDILNALDYLHQRGIIHRDIKPTNIKITPEGSAVLVDFGIAKDIDASGSTLSSGARGTPGFAPPEQYRSRTDVRSDIYALGATLYVVLTGILPADALTRLLDPESYIPLTALTTNLKHSLIQSIDKALALDPKERFASAQEMLAGLRGELELVSARVPVKSGDVVVGPVRATRKLRQVPAADPLKTNKLTALAAPSLTDPLKTRVLPANAQTPAKSKPDWLVRSGIAAILVVLLMLFCLLGRPFLQGILGAASLPQTATLQPGATSALAQTAGNSLIGNGDGSPTSDPPTTSTLAATPAASSSAIVDALTQTEPGPTSTINASGTPLTATSPIVGSPTSSATLAPGVTPSATLAATSTQTATSAVTGTQPPSVTASATLPATATLTPTATRTATFTNTATNTATSTPVPTATPRPTIALNPNSTTLVTGASTTMSVVISAAQASDTAISLSSSNASAATVPGSVVISAGATSASFSVQGQGAGSATITASLAGANPSSATVTVNKADTTTTLSANPNPVTVGQQVSVSYGVNVNAPGSGSVTGGVNITLDGATICSASAPSGSCSFTPSSTGGKTLAASYSGDGNFNGSSNSTGLTVNPLGISLAPPNSCATTLNNIQLTVTISAVEAGNTTVSLSSSGGVTVPASVNISAGSTSAQFTASSLLPANGTVTATLPGNLGGASSAVNVKFALPLIGCN